MSANGAGQFAQVSGLGAIPVTSSFTELYEALQRGVVDCAASSASTMERIGTAEVTPWLITDSDAGLADFLVYFGFSAERWSSLPLVAQQLLYDRMDAIFTTEPRGLAELGQQWYASAEEAGGGIAELSDDAHLAFATVNDSLLEEIGGAGADVDAIENAWESWHATVAELYPRIAVPMDEFLAGDAFEGVDLQPFSDVLFEEVLLAHRPE